MAARREAKKPWILSLGSINADFQFKAEQPLGSIETMKATSLRRLSGGKAANVAVLARRLGHPALLLGRVGRDDLAEQALASLEEAGVNLAGVRCSASDGTAVSVIAVPPSGKKCIMLAGEANLAFTDEDIAALAAPLGQAPDGSVLVCDYEITPQAVSAALRQGAARGWKAIVDPSFPQAVPKEDLRLAYALTPNQQEAVELAGSTPDAGKDDLLDVAQRLASLGPQVVCIKLEDGGTLLWTREEAVRIDAAPVEVVDTTGAGDAFTGAFAVAILEGRSPREAALFATAASELAVTVFGSQPSYPDRRTLDAHLASTDRRITVHRSQP